MVTMSSEKLAQKACQQGPSRENSKCLKEDREDSKKEKAITSLPPNVQVMMYSIPSSEESPNCMVYKKMEAIVEKMQDESTGVPVRTVKSFMSKIPSVFTGTDLVAWIAKNMEITETWESLHIANMLCSHGYLFPIDDHCLVVKNDNTYYRFQTPYFWPSNQWEPENTDYAVYLCKRTMQNKARLELADYEAEALAKLQKILSRKWEFIFMQAEAQSKVDKKRDKLERKVLDSQERAFWDLHRPMPGCIDTTELDPKKMVRLKALKEKRQQQCQELIQQLNLKNNPIVTVTNPQDIEEQILKNEPNANNVDSAEHSIAEDSVDGSDIQSFKNIEELPTLDEKITAAKKLIEKLKQKCENRAVRTSKMCEMLVSYGIQYVEYDPFISPPEHVNPWLSETTELWDQETCGKEPLPLRRVKRWSFNLPELLRDPAGVEHFDKFLSKEFSGENLKFYMAVQEYKNCSLREAPERAKEIWKEFLANDAPSPVNIDAASRELTRTKIESGTADTYCFDQAQAHVYHLMKSDSYTRYLRSDMYKDYLNGSKKKTSVKGIRSIVSFTGRNTAAN